MFLFQLKTEELKHENAVVQDTIKVAADTTKVNPNAVIRLTVAADSLNKELNATQAELVKAKKELSAAKELLKKVRALNDDALDRCNSARDYVYDVMHYHPSGDDPAYFSATFELLSRVGSQDKPTNINIPLYKESELLDKYFEKKR